MDFPDQLNVHTVIRESHITPYVEQPIYIVRRVPGKQLQIIAIEPDDNVVERFLTNQCIGK